MLTTEKRIEALEHSASDDRVTVVIVEDGETRADALKRVGLGPDAHGVVFGTVLDVTI